MGTCVAVGGACALVYEVVWARMLGVFLGAGAPAQAIVLASFLGGLAVGNAVLGRWVDRHGRHALLIYAALEAAIGLYAIVSPSLHLVIGRTYLAVLDAVPATSLALGAKVAAAIAFVALPAVAMGGTVPALARHLVADPRQIGATVSRLYFANTLGAAVGVFAAGFVLMPRFGAATTAMVVGALNLAVAAAAVAVWVVQTRQARLSYDDDSRTADGVEDAKPADDTNNANDPTTTVASVSGAVEPSDGVAARASDRRLSITLLVAVGVMGWASLTLEVAWIRLFAMVFGSSTQAFTLVLAAFISGIALGSALAPRLLRRWSGREVALLAWMLAIGAALACVQIAFYERLPYWQFTLAHALERRPHVYPLYLAAQSGLALLWMLPLTIVVGAALPVATQAFGRGADRVGSSVGSIFGANTAGNVLGPLTALFVLMPTVGLRHTVTAAVFALAAASALAAATAGVRRLPAAVALMAVVAALLPSWSGAVLHSGGFRRWTLEPGATFAEFVATRERSRPLFEVDGATDSVIVLENREGRRFIKVNGKTDASDADDMPTQRLVAHIPMLLHRASTGRSDPDVYVVGVGSGVTVGNAARHGEATVTAAELSGGVLAASRFFDHVNEGYADAANVTVHASDARELLGRAGGQFDVIINQPSNPWIAGNAALFSLEFFRLAHDRLATDGLMAQWMHVYAMDDGSVETVMNTFGAVFPYVTVWWPHDVDVLLIGSKRPLVVDLDALEAALEQPWLQAQMADVEAGAQINSVSRLLALQVASEAEFRAAFPGAPPHTTDLRPVLEFAAPRAQFVGSRSERLLEIDERLRPGDETRLLWAGLDPTRVDRDDLWQMFAARSTPASARLAASLAHSITVEPSASGDFASLFARGGGNAVHLEAWAHSITDRSTADDCRALLDASRSILPPRASVFHRPSPSAISAAVTRCGDVHRAAAPFLDAMLVELLWEVGWHGAARSSAAALLGERPPPAVREAMERIVDGGSAAVSRPPRGAQPPRPEVD